MGASFLHRIRRDEHEHPFCLVPFYNDLPGPTPTPGDDCPSLVSHVASEARRVYERLARSIFGRPILTILVTAWDISNMASLNVHMPADLREFVDQRTKKGGFSTPTEYVRHLIREDQQRQAARRIEELFLEGVRGGRAKGSVEDLFKRLHKFVDGRRGQEKPVKRSNGKATRSHTRG